MAVMISGLLHEWQFSQVANPFRTGRTRSLRKLQENSRGWFVCRRNLRKLQEIPADGSFVEETCDCAGIFPVAASFVGECAKLPAHLQEYGAWEPIRSGLPAFLQQSYRNGTPKAAIAKRWRNLRDSDAQPSQPAWSAWPAFHAVS